MMRTGETSDDLLSAESLFYNLPELLRPSVVADLLGISIKTIYDWHYKRTMRNLPKDLFIKVNRLLYIRTAGLKRWITSQNHCLT